VTLAIPDEAPGARWTLARRRGDCTCRPESMRHSGNTRLRLPTA